VEVLAQNPAVMVQPFAAEEKVVWGLLGSTAAAGAVCFAYAGKWVSTSGS
jgi:hypothetical protein